MLENVKEREEKLEQIRKKITSKCSYYRFRICLFVKLNLMFCYIKNLSSFLCLCKTVSGETSNLINVDFKTEINFIFANKK